MSHKDEVRDFLASRRSRITPAQAGITVSGRTRRVPGLRREEVATLAGVSVDYYVRFERGDLSGASDAVLESLSRALQLEDAEREYLFELARKAAPQPRSRRSRPPQVRAAVQSVLDGLEGTPAWVRNDRYDMLATNSMARALHAPMLSGSHHPANVARFVYLDPRAPDFFVDWEYLADDIAAVLRQEAARHPYDKSLTELIGELSTRSEVFRQRWAAHIIRFHRSGVKKLRHPIVGELELNYETMELPGDPGIAMIVYTAVAGSPSADALKLLASWAATQVSEVPFRASQPNDAH
ncbi:helix-turn-helix domain-containing protein [Herbiconiux daphne]|uniref:Helix-turn-helix transcriptional regulator n=1 Tax=Herbiconiux daphne TaxID=2970914 RepID=A0ABT2H560_9MICO|nr:helix-turn-helix transcriptional regulator [Herbiconiux daphne]MCS5735074.1 helix-turn-helix transcriptional regulator [Herbiconiux daphne]